MQVVEAFKRVGLNFEKRVLPCGHYTTAKRPSNTWMAGTWDRSFTAPSKRFVGRRPEKPLSSSRQPQPKRISFRVRRRYWIVFRFSRSSFAGSR